MKIFAKNDKNYAPDLRNYNCTVRSCVNRAERELFHMELSFGVNKKSIVKNPDKTKAILRYSLKQSIDKSQLCVKSRENIFTNVFLTLYFF